MSGTHSRHQGRNAWGHFAPRNSLGEGTRFTLGRSGNPLGRPPSCQREFQAFIMDGVTVSDLRRILADPRTRSTARVAAKWALLYHTRQEPISQADVIQARRYYRSWYRKPFDALFAIFTDEHTTPERREAARQRLCKWWAIHYVVL